MYNTVWALYSFLGLSVFFSLIGMGIMSLLMSFITLFFAKKWCDISDLIKKDHFLWIVRSSQFAVLVHIALVAFFAYEALHVVSGFDSETFITAVATHWVIDYVVELSLGIWLAYRTIKGMTKLSNSKSPWRI
ncbi:MAG: hypothetical protein GQ547_02395 [Methylophaga sp.]|nr:hypothetical protein [Methylophaga sp.]